MSSAEIETRDKGTPDEHTVLAVDLHHYGVKDIVSFNVDWVADDHREWLREVVGKLFVKVAKEARAEGVRETRQAIKKALGIEDDE